MLSSTILMGSASVTAFAQANENAEQAETAEQVIEEQPAEQPAAEGTPFSTSGNGQLVDDKENDSSKQFLTVQTKNGNTFYMVIDRSGTSENVYMMSLVDENDSEEDEDDEDEDDSDEDEEDEEDDSDEDEEDEEEEEEELTGEALACHARLQCRSVPSVGKRKDTQKHADPKVGGSR